MLSVRILLFGTVAILSIIQGQLPNVFLHMIGGMCGSICRALVLCLVLIAGTVIKQVPSNVPIVVGSPSSSEY